MHPTGNPGPGPLPPVTVLLQAAAAGDRRVIDDLYALLYPDLKRVARAALHRQGRAESMHTTLLVHESFLHLVDKQSLRLQDRQHFFAYAAKTMRHIIVDEARLRAAQRRGGDVEHLSLDDDEVLALSDLADSDQLLRVDQALQELEALDPGLTQLVEMRFFGGFGEVEIAELLAVSERTVRRRWDKARAWLFLALGEEVQPLG